jgi:UDP-N-acetylglucosamine 4-epimerase
MELVRLTRVQQELKEQPKSWLVTGCAGFIGSNLVEALLKLNQKVVGLDNFSTGYQHNLDDIQSNVTEEQWHYFTFVKGDITDFEICLEVTKDVDVVLHQAALGSVPRSIANPIVSNASNVTGFLNMITACKESGVKRFVYASSSSVYGDSQELPKVEERTGSLLSPYAVTKYVNELYANVFYKTYGLETIGLRYFNVFGKRQDPNGVYAAVIPKWIGNLLNSEEVFINGDGETSRDFTYIENVVQANLLAGTIENEEVFGASFNTAVGGKSTLNELYDAINMVLKENLETFTPIEPTYRDFRKGDIRHSNANIEKMKKLFGFEPTHNISEGLEASILWYINTMK